VAWLVVIAIIAALNYGARFADATPAAPDALFRWSTAIGTLVIEAVIFAIVLLIARGLSLRDAFALRRPASWSDAVRIALAALAAVWATSLVLEVTVGHASREQAVPQFWDPARVPAFVASALVIGLFVPIVEESMCRGIGFSLLTPYGHVAAIVGTALAFALAHGAVLDLPWVFVTGLGLGYLRYRSGSLLPSIGLHATINSIAVLAAGLVARG
jgi:membrane protease YdiL (CAAX protease family)